jgi:hypothetical protein
MLPSPLVLGDHIPNSNQSNACTKLLGPTHAFEASAHTGATPSNFGGCCCLHACMEDHSKVFSVMGSRSRVNLGGTAHSLNVHLLLNVGNVLHVGTRISDVSKGTTNNLQGGGCTSFSATFLIPCTWMRLMFSNSLPDVKANQSNHSYKHQRADERQD